MEKLENRSSQESAQMRNASERQAEDRAEYNLNKVLEVEHSLNFHMGNHYQVRTSRFSRGRSHIASYSDY